MLKLSRCAWRYASVVWWSTIILLAFASLNFAFAQEYPDRPVTLVVPFSPGGASDILARLISEGLAGHWSHPVLLDYRPGGGTIVATDHVARAGTDGHTIGLIVTSFVINPAIHGRLPYDAARDFRPITQIGAAPIVLLAHRNFSANNIDQLVTQAKANPGRIAYASPGVGTATHMAGELLEHLAGIELLHVPYGGLAQALPDVLSGRVPLLFDIWHSARPHVESGNLKVIGVASPGGIPERPEFQSLDEVFPGYGVLSIQGIVAPAGTPDVRIDQIANAMRAVILSEEFGERIEGLGMQAVGSTPEEFGDLLAAEIEKWNRVARDAGISVNN